MAAAGTVTVVVARRDGGTSTLGLGDHAFWSDRDHTLVVRGSAGRLRVAIDHADEGAAVNARVEGPRGSTVIAPREGIYSAEWVLPSPAPGRYRVHVEGPDPFWLRARLELRPASARDGRPNLQALPPYDLTFLEPITNGATGGVPRGRRGGDGCHQEEVDEGAGRCLRMAFGIRNAGDGPFALFYPQGAAGENRPLFQRVYRPDGTSTSRAAGTAYWHASHRHYHQDHAVALQLLYDRGHGRLEPAEPLRKKGFAHRNELLRPWDRFLPSGRQSANASFGLRPGWADYYEWDRPGSYVDFSGLGDGRYVLRLTADPDGLIVESDEADNVAYSLIEVGGERVRVLESGIGTDPYAGCRARVPVGAAAGPDRRGCGR